MKVADAIEAEREDAEWYGRVLTFRSDADPDVVSSAMALVWGAEVYETGYYAEVPMPDGLHAMVFRRIRRLFREYRVVLTREPHVSPEAAALSFGDLVAQLWQLQAEIERSQAELTAIDGKHDAAARSAR